MVQRVFSKRVLIEAYFIGLDGSEGYKLHGTYKLICEPGEENPIHIEREDGSGCTEYGSLASFLHNWSAVSVLPFAPKPKGATDSEIVDQMLEEYREQLVREGGVPGPKGVALWRELADICVIERKRALRAEKFFPIFARAVDEIEGFFDTAELKALVDEIRKDIRTPGA